MEMDHAGHLGSQIPAISTHARNLKAFQSSRSQNIPMPGQSSRREDKKIEVPKLIVVQNFKPKVMSIIANSQP